MKDKLKTYRALRSSSNLSRHAYMRGMYLGKQLYQEVIDYVSRGAMSKKAVKINQNTVSVTGEREGIKLKIIIYV